MNVWPKRWNILLIYDIDSSKNWLLWSTVQRKKRAEKNQTIRSREEQRIIVKNKKAVSTLLEYHDKI